MTISQVFVCEFLLPEHFVYQKIKTPSAPVGIQRRIKHESVLDVQKGTDFISNEGLFG